MTTGKFIYSNRLLNIETGQQLTKNKHLNFLNKDGEMNPMILSKVNNTIDDILHVEQTGQEKFYIYLPNEIEEKLPKQLLKQISKDITSSEVRVITAIVALAQFAKAKNELVYFDQINRAYFELDLSELYQMMGVGNSKGKLRTLVKEALFGLNQKKYVLIKNSSISISHLVQVHEVDGKNPNKLKITVEGCFFNFEKESYFHLPADINKKIRKFSTGRPNAQVELFIKCLYQAKHCTKNNTVEYSYDTVFKLMKLQKLVDNKNHKHIQPTIEKAFDLAKKLDLVKSIKEGKDRMGKVKYNIEFC
ncbi:MAG: hypothetical protein KTR26_14105 [Flammeovirgaceae bacterium]|nr:hypothetical protein [Flammeovirgaceae bacterium]